jgi:hypothetical protein
MNEEIKYGLIVVDKDYSKRFDNDGNYLIHHFCGYWKKPNMVDILSLRAELKEDVSFELNNIIDKLEIIDCPPDILNYFKKLIKDQI